MQEHMERGDSERKFNPGNYDMETTPREEYLTVLDAKKGKEASKGKRCGGRCVCLCSGAGILRENLKRYKVHTATHTYTQFYIYTHICIYIHTYIHTYIHIYIYSVCVCVCLCSHIMPCN
jgi:hypothetical protein